MHIDPKLDVDVEVKIDRWRTYIPQELRDRPQWVVWRFGEVRSSGKRAKVPDTPGTGQNAKPNDPSTWRSFEDAISTYRTGMYEGIGYMFAENDPYAGVDLDECIRNSIVDADALEIAKRLNTYTEYSNSGTGLHCIVRGSVPRGRKKPEIEIYSDTRFFAFTGSILEGFPATIQDREEELLALYDKAFGPEESPTSSTGGGGASNGEARSVPAMSDQDRERLEIALNFPGKGENIRRLWHGDISGFKSHSEAVGSLLFQLAFFFEKDPVRMDRMFRNSGLYRGHWVAKWARRKDQELDYAIQQTKNVYDPNFSRNRAAIHTNGTAANGSAPKPASPEPPLLQKLLDELQSQESTAAVELWAARTVERAAQLKPSEQLQLEVTIKQHLGNDAAAERFLDKKWTPAVKGSTRKTRNKDDALDLSEQMFEALHGLGYSFRLNELEDTIEVNGQRIDDILRSEIHLKMKDRGFPKTYVDDAINTLAGRSLYHPVQEYLNGLKWDGENHFYGFASFLHGDGTVVEYDADNREPFIKVAVYRWMLGCVATALDGANMDVFQHQNPMLVLIGAQGKGKSTLVRWLCSGLGPRYYRESPLNPHSTDDVRSMVTKWIWEVSELGASLRRADREALKSFITTQQFTYRKPYARYDITKPKLCSLVGTLNPDGSGFLDDPSGHRRYIPVVLNDIDYRYRELVDVDQLWAQIVHEYRQGKRPELTPAEREILAQAHQQNEVDNPLETYINKYFDIDPHNELMRTHTSTIIDRLRAFGVSLPNNVRVAGKEIAEVLSGLGLHNNGNVPFRADGTRGRGWIGISPNSKEPPIN